MYNLYISSFLLTSGFVQLIAFDELPWLHCYLIGTFLYSYYDEESEVCLCVIVLPQDLPNKLSFIKTSPTLTNRMVEMCGTTWFLCVWSISKNNVISLIHILMRTEPASRQGSPNSSYVDTNKMNLPTQGIFLFVSCSNHHHLNEPRKCMIQHGVWFWIKQRQ